MMKKIPIALKLLIGIMSILLSQLAMAEESATPTTKPSTGKYLEYKHYYTKEGFQESGRRGTYSLDPHIWVYTSKFAKRFGMPKEWIDDDLEGAEAIAFRYDLDVYGSKCGYFGDLEKCQPSRACVLDMYIPDTAKVPWNTETRFDSKYGHKSHFLKGNTKDMPQYFNRRARYPNYCCKQKGVGSRNCPAEDLYICEVRPYEYSMGIDSISINHTNGTGSSGNLDVLEFDRDIYTGLDYISGSANCIVPEKREVELLLNHFLLKENGSIDIRATRKMYSENTFAHKITIPNSYMGRLEAYSKEVYEPNSLLEQLREHLSSQPPSK